MFRTRKVHFIPITSPDTRNSLVQVPDQGQNSHTPEGVAEEHVILMVEPRLEDLPERLRPVLPRVGRVHGHGNAQKLTEGLPTVLRPEDEQVLRSDRRSHVLAPVEVELAGLLRGFVVLEPNRKKVT